MVARETLWECLTKQIENDSNEDSDHSTNSSDSIGFSPRKRLRRLLEFKMAKELEDLKSVASEVLELKDYAEWFMSRSESKIEEILYPRNYCDWFSTLGTEAKANVILDPHNYCTWYHYFVVEGTEPSRDDDYWETTEQKNKRYGELALAYFNATGDCTKDYEYTGQCDILEFEEFIHLNFYARLKVTESRPEPGPKQVFFAEVDSENKIILCCILDSEDYGDSDVQHPAGYCHFPRTVSHFMGFEEAKHRCIVHGRKRICECRSMLCTNSLGTSTIA
ncbi:uncharacterized protein LOC141623350 [Silene latifolia]|uniref:uncharacterized protein LOC141623350 n=1 Tax=Silene latifolia TaxID=37657 RepID=UPI003D7854FB